MMKTGLVFSTNTCGFYHVHVETINHLLLTRKEANKVWYKCDQRTDIHSAHLGRYC